ncbi:Gfo/Idh/MocA family protein [Roseimaritima sediminicola]|uniref:Gfo/Idh/MocA family protein n=1 Tax=Roseimaritima sediminicola TaxID=2662066 RepID=UPI00129854B3|nr:Gfo/Idh/MocA family oxidoreductase [Roseimaritima sediminicola]
MRAGILGVGFMGWIHYLAYQASEKAELVAFCSRDAAKRAGDWRGIQGNFGPPAGQIDVSGLATYETLDQMLADDSIDLIDICLPPHLHVDAVEKCLAAGKRVLCEKPLALTAEEATGLIAKAEPGQLLVAHILPFMPEFRYVADAARDNRFGKLLGGQFKRVIGPPDWIPDFYDPARVGGPLLDLHVHDAHFIRMLFGMPTEVLTRGRMRGETPQYFESTFATADPQVVLSACCGVIDQPARPFTHGYEVHFEKATLRFEFAAHSDGESSMMPLSVFQADGSIEQPDLGDGDPVKSFHLEIDAAADSLSSGQAHPALDGQVAADAIRLCDAQLRSVRTGKPVTIEAV